MTNYDILKEYEAHQTPVPSYEEWQAKLEENTQLKELLKECREEIGDEIDDCTDPRIELFAKINEVLK